MDAKTLLELYNKVQRCERNALPELERPLFKLDPKPEPCESADSAHAKLVEFLPTEGWIGFQSANRAFTGGQVPVMDAETGKLLSAEAVNAKGESLHIRYDGAGRWLATRYQATAGADYLADLVTHIAHGEGLGKLRYRRFWRIDAEHGAEPFAACFIGFGKE